MAKCPECGSSHVERLTAHGLMCMRCGHDASSYEFRTKEEADELADNGRNTGGKSYYRPR